MGGFVGPDSTSFVTGTLNDQFGSANIQATFKGIEELRKTFPNLLNPKQNPSAKERRKQTLRFAAFQIQDDLVFSNLYPAPKFTKWLKYLTWLYMQTNGTFTLDGASFSGTAGELIVKVLAQALPHGGTPKPVQFSYNHDSDASDLTVVATTTTTPFTISVTSPNQSEVSDNDEDNV
jgi:hypothetical protein